EEHAAVAPVVDPGLDAQVEVPVGPGGVEEHAVAARAGQHATPDLPARRADAVRLPAGHVLAVEQLNPLGGSVLPGRLLRRRLLRRRGDRRDPVQTRGKDLALARPERDLLTVHRETVLLDLDLPRPRLQLDLGLLAALVPGDSHLPA